MDSAPAFKAASVIDWFVKASGSSVRVLDLACGPGIVAEAVAPHVEEIHGVDITPEMINLAKARFANLHSKNGRFEIAEVVSLPFKDSCFDAVLTRLSFHHFPDVPAVLSEARRVLKPKGRLIAADVLSSEDAEESALHNALEQLRDPTHVRMLDREELLGSIRSAGFEVLSQETWKQDRTFSDWAQIVADPGRTDPLRRVMRAFARSGPKAGIELREKSGEIHFVHTWLLVAAKVI